MKILLAVTMVFINGVSVAQQKVLLNIPVSGKTIGAFIPKGYDTLATAVGDLNKDNIADYALVLKPLIEDSVGEAVDETDIPQRILIVLLKNSTGYSMVARSDSAIFCKSCGGVLGDPFAGITITNGILVVEHYGGSSWRWEFTHKFRYQQNEFYLIGTTTLSYWNVKMCEKLNEFAGTQFKDINLVTGAYEQKKVSEECKLLVSKKGKQKIEPLKKLSAFNIDN